MVTKVAVWHGSLQATVDKKCDHLGYDRVSLCVIWGLLYLHKAKQTVTLEEESFFKENGYVSSEPT